MGILPKLYENNIGNLFDDDGKAYLIRQDVPFFWIIPRSGGNIIRYVLSYCFRSVLSCEAGAEKEDQKVLEVFENDGCQYVNVNTETSSGIQRAKELGLVNSGLSYAIFSSRLSEIISIFNTDHQARSFPVLRHPVERAISLFYQEQARDPKQALKSIEVYFNENPEFEEDNYMVRSLANKPSAAL